MAPVELEPFDPQWLEMEAAMGGRQTLQPKPVEEMRDEFMGIFDKIAPMIPPPNDAVKTEDVHITPDQRVRIFTPTASRSGDGKFAVGLYIHGGGWFSGTVDGEDFLCRAISEQANMILYSTDYRKAPENPYPAGLNDCIRAYEFMHATASKYNGDPMKKFVMGGSAGGNLAASVALSFARDQEKKAAGLLIACANTCDAKAIPDEYKARYRPELYTDTPFIGIEVVGCARDMYAASDPSDPLYSPLLHPNIKYLRQVHVSAPTKDPTHQDTVFFYEECVKHGVEADLVEWKGWPHYFWIIPTLPKSVEFLEVWCARLRAMIDAA